MIALRPALRSLLVTASLFVLTQAAEAARRVAFVVGNSAYETQGALTNPANDAADVATTLRKLGFEVVEAHDLNKRDFARKKLEFVEKLDEIVAQADATGDEPPIALFYYSGHGMQVDGTNYVIPVDARIEKPGDERRAAVTLDSIIKDINGDDAKDNDRKGLISIIILDACRDNPFAKQLARSLGQTRAAEQPMGGLAQVNVGGGSLIVYATDPGKVALDGSGRNSPFTSAFLTHAATPGIEVMHLMTRIRADVLNATRTQRPWASTSLTDQIFLAGRGEATLHQAALTTGAPQIGQDSQPRRLTPPVNPQDVTPKDGAPKEPPRAQKSEAELAGDRCDAVATDKEDSLRSPKVKPVLRIVTNIAIPACEEAIKLNPKTVRFYNQLARAYDMADRHTDAVRVLRIAADRGSSYAVASLGAYTYHGLGGMKRDYAQSRLWLEKAAALGAVRAQKYLAYLDAQGVGAERNIDKAVELYNRAIAAGDTSSMAWLGQLYASGAPGLDKNFAKARELFQKSSDQDDPEGMQGLAFLAQNGYGEPIDFEKARRWYEKAAAYELPDAMFSLGELYNFGSAGVPKDQALAKQWYQRAAEQQNSPSLYRLGEFALLGVAGDKDLKEARTFLQKAIDRNFTFAMVYTANLLTEGTFGKVDREGARELLKRAAELNDEQAQTLLANFDRQETPEEACDRLASNPVDPARNPKAKPVTSIDAEKVVPVCREAAAKSPNDVRFANQLGRGLLDLEQYTEAMKVFRAAADKKSAYGALWVGNLYMRGLGVPKDLAQAKIWYEKGTALGQQNAAYNLARMYLDGDGMAKDPQKAREVFERAASLGEPQAYTELGHLYLNGKLVGGDERRARTYYEKAAELNDPFAMHQLGFIYSRGRGVAKNPALARVWYARGAEKGDVFSMRALADLYITAQGGDQELEKARGLLEQAAGSGDAEAMTTLAQAYMAGTFGASDPEKGKAWYQKAADKGNATAKRYVAAISMDATAAAQKCDETAGDKDDPLRSIEFKPAARVSVADAIPTCEAAVAANPDVPRYQNQLGRAYIADGRYFDAWRTFSKVAEDGSAFAALWLGNMRTRGLGTPKDLREAARWYEKAADQGMVIGMYNLGENLLTRASAGEDPDKNGPAAIKSFERASALGHGSSMYMMARIYEVGRIVPKNLAKEVEWLQRAAKYDDDDALARLSVLYHEGEGVAKDLTKARDFAKRAEEQGNLHGRLNYALMLLLGSGGPKDPALAQTLLEKNVFEGHVSTMLEYARAVLQGQLGPVDKERARLLYQRAADLGSQQAKDEIAKLDKAQKPPAAAAKKR